MSTLMKKKSLATPFPNWKKKYTLLSHNCLNALEKTFTMGCNSSPLFLLAKLKKNSHNLFVLLKGLFICEKPIPSCSFVSSRGLLVDRNQRKSDTK
jgi:hypothetical protein